MIYHIGLDSTDSNEGGCTTWTASKIIDNLYLEDPEIIFIDFPRLVRLNPNIPFKTRGNGAINIIIDSNLNISDLKKIIKTQVVRDVEKYNSNTEIKQAAFAIKIGEKPSDELYRKALSSFVSVQEAKSIVDYDFIWPEDSISLVGALGAISSDLHSDFTFELLLYRYEKNCGSKRIIQNDNVAELAKKYPETFSSFDFDQNRELIAPSSPDPVFCGVRGEDTVQVKQFSVGLEISETLESWTIFRTNQATDAHVRRHCNDISPYRTISTIVKIIQKPNELEGGHLKLEVRINHMDYDCMAFEPTKHLRNIARLLIPGDKIFIHGNIAKNEFGVSIHLEYFEIIHLKEKLLIVSPKCNCNNRMTKAGKFSGYKCKNCGNLKDYPEILKEKRELFIGQKVYASSSAQRHLTRPSSRIHRRNREKMERPKYHEIRGKINTDIF